VIEGNAELLPHQLLRKFIAYARTYVHPKLDEEAKKAIQDFYMQLRQSHHANDSTPITLRQLESLVRLAQV
jgi:DNA helicase MCM8